VGYYEKYSDISLPTLRVKLWVPPSKVEKPRKKIYLKMQTNTLLRVRKITASSRTRNNRIV